MSSILLRVLVRVAAIFDVRRTRVTAPKSYEPAKLYEPDDDRPPNSSMFWVSKSKSAMSSHIPIFESFSTGGEATVLVWPPVKAISSVTGEPANEAKPLMLACFDGLALQQLADPDVDLTPAYKLLEDLVTGEM